MTFVYTMAVCACVCVCVYVCVQDHVQVPMYMLSHILLQFKIASQTINLTRNTTIGITFKFKITIPNFVK